MDPSPRFGDLTIASFIDRLASAEPVPGGGSAAAVAGSLGASLVAMVAVLSQDRPKYAQHAALHAEVGPAARSLADRLLDLADQDAVAYAGYGLAMRLPKESEADQAVRSAAIRQAALASSLAPFRTVEACRDVVTLAESLAGRSNRNASSDLEVAATLALAAARSAAANVDVNLPSIGDEEVAGDLRVRTVELVDQVERLAARVREIVRSGEAREPVATATA